MSGHAGDPRILLMFFYCLLVVLLQVFIGLGCQPISGRRPPVVVLPFSCPLFLFSSCSPLGVLPSCCPVVLLALSSHSLSLYCPFGVFVLFSFPYPFILCSPPHVLLWSFCCPPAVVLFTLLSAGSAAIQHHNNNRSCRLSCLGSMLL